jgi:hypothetical protein
MSELKLRPPRGKKKPKRDNEVWQLWGWQNKKQEGFLHFVVAVSRSEMKNKNRPPLRSE